MRFELRPTDDGSLTVFDRDAGECFKSCHAARSEAEHVFFRPAVLEHPLFGHRPLEVLELGFGLGTNYLHFRDQNFAGCFRSVERDLSGVEFFLAAAPDDSLAELVRNGEAAHGSMRAVLHRGDFFVELRKLIGAGYRADAVLFDPFSPKANPGAWTGELFSLAREIGRAHV